MKRWDFGLSALASCVAAALLGGCGTGQPPAAEPGALPQSYSAANEAADRGSWISPQARSEDLLYLGSGDKVFVLTYPEGKLVGTLALPSSNEGGFCSDRQGHVFVVVRTSYEPPTVTNIYEYAHGQSARLRTLTVKGFVGFDCSVDPRSGNLALAGTIGSSKYGGVEVFSNANGNPTLYRDRVKGFIYCGYDASGNLYADGFSINNRLGIAVLPRGASKFSHYKVDTGQNGGNIQWDGSFITVRIETGNHTKLNTLLRVRISGSAASIVDKIHLQAREHWLEQTWIQGQTIVGTMEGKGAATAAFFIWKYPDGRRPSLFHRIHRTRGSFGVTVSVAPH